MISEESSETTCPGCGVRLGTQTTCTSCGYESDSDVVSMENRGSEVASSPQRAAASTAQEDTSEGQPSGKRCPNCEAVLGETQVLCLECGYHLELGRVLSDGSDTSYEPKKAFVFPYRALLMVGGAIAVVCGAVMLQRFVDRVSKWEPPEVPIESTGSTSHVEVPAVPSSVPGKISAPAVSSESSQQSRPGNAPVPIAEKRDKAQEQLDVLLKSDQKKAEELVADCHDHERSWAALKIMEVAFATPAGPERDRLIDVAARVHLSSTCGQMFRTVEKHETVTPGVERLVQKLFSLDPEFASRNMQGVLRSAKPLSEHARWAGLFKYLPKGEKDPDVLPFQFYECIGRMLVMVQHKGNFSLGMVVAVDEGVATVLVSICDSNEADELYVFSCAGQRGDPCEIIYPGEQGRSSYWVLRVHGLPDSLPLEGEARDFSGRSGRWSLGLKWPETADSESADPALPVLHIGGNPWEPKQNRQSGRCSRPLAFSRAGRLCGIGYVPLTDIRKHLVYLGYVPMEARSSPSEKEETRTVLCFRRGSMPGPIESVDFLVGLLGDHESNPNSLSRSDASREGEEEKVLSATADGDLWSAQFTLSSENAYGACRWVQTRLCFPDGETLYCRPQLVVIEPVPSAARADSDWLGTEQSRENLRRFKDGKPYRSDVEIGWPPETVGGTEVTQIECKPKRICWARSGTHLYLADHTGVRCVRLEDVAEEMVLPMTTPIRDMALSAEGLLVLVAPRMGSEHVLVLDERSLAEKRRIRLRTRCSDLITTAQATHAIVVMPTEHSRAWCLLDLAHGKPTCVFLAEDEEHPDGNVRQYKGHGDSCFSGWPLGVWLEKWSENQGRVCPIGSRHVAGCLVSTDGRDILFLVPGIPGATPDVIQFPVGSPDRVHTLGPQGQKPKRGRGLGVFTACPVGRRLICGGVVRDADNGRMLLDLTDRAEPVIWLSDGNRMLGREWETGNPLLLDERGVVVTQLTALVPYIGRGEKRARLIANPTTDGFIAYTPGKSAHWITFAKEGN